MLTCVCLSHQATAEANNLAAVASAKDQYYKNMEKVSSPTCEKPNIINRERIDNYLSYVSFLCSFIFKVCGGDLPYVSPESLEEKHHFNFREALHAFSSTKKMGGQEFCDRYQEQLEKELEDMWQSFAKHNEVRRLFHKHNLTFMLIFKEMICLK